jgi:hypothetical protein
MRRWARPRPACGHVVRPGARQRKSGWSFKRLHSEPQPSALTRRPIPFRRSPKPRSALKPSKLCEAEFDLHDPAVGHVDNTYGDLDATITVPDADRNLGIKIFLNGTLVSNIILDTSDVAADMIDYVATNGSGDTAPRPTPSLCKRLGQVPQQQLRNSPVFKIAPTGFAIDKG